MCEDVQAALSARLDGEDPGLSSEAVDGHVAGCATCSAWLAGVQALTIGQADPPDLTDRIMAAVAPHVARARVAAEERARRQVLRIAVAVAAVAQFALAVPTFLGTAHTGRDMGSFDIAVAVGFLLAA